jgi:hypothetical protein
MPSKQIAAVVGTGALVLAVVAVGAVALGDDDTPEPMSATARAEAMATSVPDLEAPTGDPELPGLASARPEPGIVTEVAGPFDDRFRFEHLRLTTRAVTGGVKVTSDVSELIDLQVVAGFYDADGRLLGQGRYTYHLDEAHEHGESGHDVHQDFRVAVPRALRDQTASAAVGVTVLVNE